LNIPDDRPWFKFWPEGIARHIDYPEVPLFEFLTATANKYPDSTAFSYRDNKITYRELDRQTGQLAAALGELGVKARDRVVLFLPNGIEYAIGYYGVLKAGAAVAPANPMYKKDELKHQLNDSGAVAIISDKEHYPVIVETRDETSLKAVVLTDSADMAGAVSLERILTEYPPSPPAIDLNPREDIAAIEYTGGTTGFPKGAMLTHYNLVANAIQNAAWLEWSKNDVIIGLLPFYHSWGACTCVNSPIYTGARVVTMPRYDADELLATIEKERATLLHGAASLYTMLINSPSITKYDLSSLRYVKAGAMPIPPDIKEKWEKITGVRMILAYGLSEASPETHTSPPERIKPGTIGIPISDTDARIVDEETGEIELPPGEVGELIIKGPQVMKGYLNRPEENRETLRDGWLYTGDLAKMDEEGYFYIVDRKKEIIKYKGYTIAPAEVEAVLYEHPAVRECAVVGEPDELAGELPKAYVVLKDEHSVCEDELIEFCKQKVSAYKRIRKVEFIEEIPKTQVGKVLRRVLRDKAR